LHDLNAGPCSQGRRVSFLGDPFEMLKSGRRKVVTYLLLPSSVSRETHRFDGLWRHDGSEQERYISREPSNGEKGSRSVESEGDGTFDSTVRAAVEQPFRIKASGFLSKCLSPDGT
jgi:hypothetical protein